MARDSEHELDEPSSNFVREQDIHIRINALYKEMDTSLLASSI